LKFGVKGAQVKKQPIGIFDSGVGGLTVFKEIRKAFPHEDIVYFGDTARVPYGPKSKSTVLEYSLQNARFLMHCGAKIIVIACNTSSSVALEYLNQRLPVPVLGVINPGSIDAVAATRNGRIGVIGTEGTIRSQAYPQAITRLMPQANVVSQACPLFVSLAEEGWEHHEVTRMVAREYLQPVLNSNIDTLVLGCTHYPILKDVLQQIAGPAVQLVDSAQAVSRQLHEVLPQPETEGVGEDQFFVSDNEDKFQVIASRILQTEITSLRRVILGESWFLA
jgi:glutamate racemase